jgi:hypothetical protein
MFYGSTLEATDWSEEMMNNWKAKIIKALLFFIPRANPDNEKFYPLISMWLVEIDDNGWPKREVALDKNNQVLFCSPDQKNTGFWTDMAIQQFTKSELIPVDQDYFEQCWQKGYKYA